MTELFINGRFLTQRTTGVQRFATEILRALDTELCSGTWRVEPRPVLLVPPGAYRKVGFRAIETQQVGRLSGHAWEQLELPRHTGKGISLNLCNTAPLAGNRVIVAIHDAGVFAVPSTYSASFLLWYRFMHSVLARRAIRVITVSDFSRRELEQHTGIDGGRITIIPSGGEHILAAPADSRVFQRLALTYPRYLLAVSSQSPHKNFEGLLSALRQVPNRDFDVVLAGGVNARVFSGTALDTSGAAHLAGYVTDGELRALYENAACFVYPSLYEGFGLPPLEAMTCGCPVVVSRLASLPEVCGDAAVYCDPHDPADIARAIETVLGNPELQADLRQRGPERAARFTWTNAARSLLDLLDELRVR